MASVEAQKAVEMKLLLGWVPIWKEQTREFLLISSLAASASRRGRNCQKSKCRRPDLGCRIRVHSRLAYRVLKGWNGLACPSKARARAIIAWIGSKTRWLVPWFDVPWVLSLGSNNNRWIATHSIWSIKRCTKIDRVGDQLSRIQNFWMILQLCLNF